MGDTPFDSGGAWFATTHWTVVLSARGPGSPGHTAALEQFCRNYWRPVYSFIRHDGKPPAEAQDLTQEFFAHLIQKDHLQRLTDRRGKFRSFLLILLKHFLSDQRDKAQAQKLGGGQTFISLDEFEAEERSALNAADRLTPDRAFEQRWARALIEHAYGKLEEDLFS